MRLFGQFFQHCDKCLSEKSKDHRTSHKVVYSSKELSHKVLHGFSTCPINPQTICSSFGFVCCTYYRVHRQVLSVYFWHLIFSYLFTFWQLFVYCFSWFSALLFTVSADFQLFAYFWQLIFSCLLTFDSCLSTFDSWFLAVCLPFDSWFLAVCLLLTRDKIAKNLTQIT